MLDQIPTPPAHTVPDLRVGLLVTVCNQHDVDRLRGVLLRADARLGDHMSLEGTVVSIEPARASEGQGFDVVVMRGHHDGEVRVVAPVRCKVLSLPRGETVVADELKIMRRHDESLSAYCERVTELMKSQLQAPSLRATASSRPVSFTDDELRAATQRVDFSTLSVDAIAEQMRTYRGAGVHDEPREIPWVLESLRAANARAVRLDAGGGDATGELAGLMRPSVNVHDEVTIDDDRIDAIKESLAAAYEQANTPTGWRWSALPMRSSVNSDVDIDAVHRQILAAWGEQLKVPSWMVATHSPSGLYANPPYKRAAEIVGMRATGTPLRASEAAGLFPGMTVHVETREDVEALVGRLVKLQGSPGDYEVTGFDSYTCEGHECRMLVAKRGGPIMLPRVFTVRDDVVKREIHGSISPGLKVGDTVDIDSGSLAHEVSRFVLRLAYDGRLVKVWGYNPRTADGPQSVDLRDTKGNTWREELPLRVTIVATGPLPSETVQEPRPVVSVYECKQAVSRSRCSDCRDTGILPGFGFGTSIDACDRPCTCDAGKRKSEGDGPSEWTVVKREVQTDEPGMFAWIDSTQPVPNGRYSAEHVTVQRGRLTRRFRIVAHHTDGRSTTVLAEHSRWKWEALDVCIRGEACIPMAIDRLLVGLREGTVTP